MKDTTEVGLAFELKVKVSVSLKRKRKLPEWMTDLKISSGSPAKRRVADEIEPEPHDTIPKGWSGIEHDASGSVGESDRVTDVMNGEGGKILAPHGNGDEDENKEIRLVVKGGRKGKGQSLFTVRDIAIHFKNLSTVRNSPKRKLQTRDWEDSPTKKIKFENTRLLWEEKSK